MKTAVKPDLKSETFCKGKSYTYQIGKDINIVDFKFYQKLFVVILSLTTILIFPESPRELENICESYNARKICNVW